MDPGLGTIVVGVDGSDNGGRALHWAERYAGLTGARLRLVHVWQHVVAYGPIVAVSPTNEEDASRELLEKARAEISLPDDRVESVLVRGQPGREVARASVDASLVVLGAQGHNPVASVLLGSASAYCSRHVAVSVVIVR